LHRAVEIKDEAGMPEALASIIEEKIHPLGGIQPLLEQVTESLYCPRISSYNRAENPLSSRMKQTIENSLEYMKERFRDPDYYGDDCLMQK
jgi:hypothetical protein